ncbi:hypothetical protein TNCV_964391 [Trichonephila clavipes]|nr:hypothetical protein TNCV_964391 [Trichonephila clavipes]
MWIEHGGPAAWPPRFPDLNPLKFWCHLKALVYEMPVATVEDLTPIRSLAVYIKINLSQNVNFDARCTFSEKVLFTEIYNETAMSNEMVRKWVRQFNDGHINVNDEARSGLTSVVNDGLAEKVNEKIRKNADGS